MNEIDIIQDLAARAIPTPSLDAYDATEILADLLVARGWGRHITEQPRPDRNAKRREAWSRKMRRKLIAEARALAIRINSRSHMTPGSYRVRLDYVGPKQSYKLGPVLIAEFTILESTDLLEHPIGARRVWIHKLLPYTLRIPKALGDFSQFIHESVFERRRGETRRVEVDALMTKTGKHINFVAWYPDGDDTHPGARIEHRKSANLRTLAESAESEVSKVLHAIAIHESKVGIAQQSNG